MCTFSFMLLPRTVNNVRLILELDLVTQTFVKQFIHQDIEENHLLNDLL